MSVAPSRRHLILTVHGIRTYGQWQERLQALVRKKSGGSDGLETIVFWHYKYGFLTVFTFLIPFLRNLMVRKFKACLIDLLEEVRPNRVDVIAHSFGAYLVIKAIEQIAPAARIHIHTVILAGSVVSPDHNAIELVGDRKPIGRLVNDCGTSDAVLLLTLLVLGVGMSGRLGLLGIKDESHLTDRYFPFGHGGYFQPSEWGDADAFMERWWLPLLLQEQAADPYDIRPARASWPDRVLYLLGANNASTTLSIYAVIGVLLGGSFCYLWRTAEAAREEAVRQRDQVSITQSRFLADLSQQLTNSGDAVSGMLVALEGLPEEGRDFKRPYVPQAEVALYYGLHARRERQLFHDAGYDAVDAKFNPVTGQIALACSDGFIRILDGKTLKPVSKLQQLDDLSWGGTRSAGLNFVMFTTEFSDDGQFFFASSLDKTVHIWNAVTWAPVFAIHGFESSGLPAGFPIHQRILLRRGTEAHVYDLSKRREISSVSWKGDANRSAFLSPDGRWVVTTAAGEDIRVFDAESGELVIHFPMASQQFTHILNFSPEGQFAVTIGETGIPELWGTRPWRMITTLPGAKYAVSRALFSPDGLRILTVHNFDRVARVWDGRTGTLLSVLEGHPEPINLAVFSPDASLVATASDPTIKLFEAKTGHLLRNLRGHLGQVTSMQFIKKGTQILAAAKDGAVRIWDTASGEDVALLRGHEVPPYNVFSLINHIDVSPDGNQLLTSSHVDKSVRLWSVDAEIDSRVLREPKLRATSVDFNPEGSLVALASLDNVVRMYDARSGGLQREFRAASTVDFVRFSPDGKQLLTISGGTGIEIFDILTGQRVTEFIGHHKAITGGAFSPDGRHIATCSVDGTWALWEKNSGKQILRMAGHGFNDKGEPNWIKSIEFSVDGKRIVTAGLDNTARIWDVASGKQLLVLKGHGNWLSSAEFSPDDNYVLTGSFDQTAKLWDSHTGAELRTFASHTQIVTKAVFSAGGNRVVTASNDETARIWDIKTGSIIAILRGHRKAIGDVASTRDGSYVATASDDATVRIWHLLTTTQYAIDYARDAATRCLTPAQRQLYFLGPEPPSWCITMQKWPYHTRAWKDWLAAKAAGKALSIPKN
jgi:WD40 repeat protein